MTGADITGADIAALVALFVVGACVGSFGNVVVWRVPKRERAAVNVSDLEGDVSLPLPRPAKGTHPGGAPADATATAGPATPDTATAGPATPDTATAGPATPDADAVDAKAADADVLDTTTSQSIVAPGSYCPHCQHALAWYENIPVGSWLVLRGRCRHCRARIPVRYPLVELVTGLLWVLLALRFGWAAELPAYLALGFGLVVLSAIDLELYLLPNKIVYPTGYAVLALLTLAAAATGDWSSLGRAVGGGAAAFAVFFVIHFVSPRGMGFGDVRLSFVLGMALGWIGWIEVFFGFFLAFALGAVIGILLMVLQLRKRNQPIPFGEFMALGALIMILWGEPIVELYLNA